MTTDHGGCLEDTPDPPILQRPEARRDSQPKIRFAPVRLRPSTLRTHVSSPCFRACARASIRGRRPDRRSSLEAWNRSCDPSQPEIGEMPGSAVDRPLHLAARQPGSPGLSRDGRSSAVRAAQPGTTITLKRVPGSSSSRPHRGRSFHESLQRARLVADRRSRPRVSRRHHRQIPGSMHCDA